MLLPGREWQEGYRFGFQNQEIDDEIKGERNSANYKYRMNDPRIGRFLSIDPLAPKYLHNSPYAFSENRVIDCGELEGLEIFYAADGTRIGSFGSSTDVRVVQDKDVATFKAKLDDANHSRSEYNRIKSNIENNAYSTGLSTAKRTMYNHGTIATTFKNKTIGEMSISTGMTEEELNIRAFLTTIRQAEASSNTVVNQIPLAYNVNYGGGTFDSYDKHPNNSVTSGGYTSNAAGAYQFLFNRWKSVADILNLDDFSPQSQDQGALYLIREQNSDNPRAAGVVDDIKVGRISIAADKLNGTWTSLPGGKQEKMTPDQFLKEYKENFINELNGNTAIETPQGKLKL